MFIKQKYFPDGTMGKLKARLVARNVDFTWSRILNHSIPTSSILVIIYMLHTADIRGAFLNAEFTSAENK